MLGPLNINLEDFGVSPKHGFLPDQFPLRELSDPYYAEWEILIRQIPALIKRKTVRQKITKLTVLSTRKFASGREWQRAYLMLAFMTHAYIWGDNVPSEILPPALSVPLLEVSSHLGLPPIATYAALNLWNFAPISPSEPLTMENLTSLHTFTGTVDESWFYLISVSMEARGGKIIPTVLKAMDAVRADNPQVVRGCLLSFAESIKDIGILLERMYEKCDPEVFYHQIRPFLAGSKNMGHAGLPNGVLYDEGNGKGEWRHNSGGSNAQSSLIQFFDVVLGVEHTPTGSPRTAAGGKHSFLEEMRTYMPGPHRSFLNNISTLSNIRPYILTSASSPNILPAYNLCIKNLSEFRDKHIKIVTRYIMIPSRKVGGMGSTGLNLAVASLNGNGDGGNLHGTGGTELGPFLKQSRDETRGAVVE